MLGVKFKLKTGYPLLFFYFASIIFAYISFILPSYITHINYAKRHIFVAPMHTNFRILPHICKKAAQPMLTSLECSASDVPGGGVPEPAGT